MSKKQNQQGQDGNFQSESPLAPVAPERKLGVGDPNYVEPDQGIKAPDDPEGYVGEDGKAAPHEQPWEVREHYDDGLDKLDTEPLP